MANVDKAIASIRESLKERTSMPEGTVVRFVRRKEVGDSWKRKEVTLSYAALFVNNRWYLTGTVGVGASCYTNKEFMDLLSSEDYSEIAVATEFEAI